MKTFRKILYASAVALALGSGSAMADPVSFLPANSPVQFKYNNLEGLVTEVGQVLSGILNVSSIGDLGANLYWASGISDGTNLTGYFTGLTLAEVLPSGSGSVLYFTGGTISLYNVPTGSFLPTSLANPLDPQICGAATCPTPWLTLNFATGSATDIASTPFNESTATLVSTLTGSDLTTPTGTGDGQLVVTGGTAAFAFGIGSSFSLQSQLQTCPSTNQSNCGFNGNTYPVASFDPVIGRTVPEPTTLALFGMALVGLGFASRRNKKSAR